MELKFNKLMKPNFKVLFLTVNSAGNHMLSIQNVKCLKLLLYYKKSDVLKNFFLIYSLGFPHLSFFAKSCGM